VAKTPTTRGHYSKGITQSGDGSIKERVFTTLSPSKALEIQKILEGEGIKSTTETLWTETYAGQVKEATMVIVDRREAGIALLSLAHKNLI
jgi:hypothetical protein